MTLNDNCLYSIITLCCPSKCPRHHYSGVEGQKFVKLEDVAWTRLAHDRKKLQPCEIGNELLGPIKCREVLDKLRN